MLLFPQLGNVFTTLSILRFYLKKRERVYYVLLIFA